jgi:hypothetical protein
LLGAFPETVTIYECSAGDIFPEADTALTVASLDSEMQTTMLFVVIRGITTI